jgi:NAD(P)-dependent dehydrogenase (short-subunit alcohol dehydrogenase family)
MGTYLITGVGRGIGREIARALLTRGDRVIGTVREPDQEFPVGDDAKRRGQFKLLRLDVRDEASIADAARLTLDDTGGLCDWRGEHLEF